MDNVKVPNKKTSQITLTFGGSISLKQTTSNPPKSKNMAKKRTVNTSFDDKPQEVDLTLTSPENKPGKKVDEIPKPVRDVSLEVTSAKRRSKRLQSPSSADEDHSPRKKRKTSQQNNSSKENQEEEGSMSPRKRRVLSSVYKATVIPQRRGKDKTPLKLRLTRIKTKQEHEEEDFTPKSNSKTKAAQLLQKAIAVSKGKPNGKKNAKNVTLKKPVGKKTKTPPPRSQQVEVRRSSRSSSLVASQSITLCYEEQVAARRTCEKVQEEKVSPQKKIPKRKKSPTKTPKKPAAKVNMKLASIFKSTKKATSDSKDKVIVVSESDVEEDKEPTEEEKEALRVKRQFLMSGVPQALKKILIQETMAVTSEYTPLPSTSHVQQIPDDLSTPEINLWKLPDTRLHQRLIRNVDWFEISPTTSQLELGFLSCLRRLPEHKMAENIQLRSAIKEEMLNFLLAEISTDNPAFPVRRVYKQLASRKLEPASEIVTNAIHGSLQSGALAKKRKQPEDEETEPRSRSKRRRATSTSVVEVQSQDKQDSIDSQDSRNKLSLKKQSNPPQQNPDKPVKEQMWTDQYAPRSSAEVLGNFGTLKKLKSWLVEWKHRTDLEMRKLRKEQLKQGKKEGKTMEEIKDKLGEDWWTSDDSDFDMSSYDEDSSAAEDDTFCNTTLITGPHGIGKTSLVHALAAELGYKVFEVNTSARRCGKHILAQLQEATQSHQVSKQNLEDVYSNIVSGAAPAKKKEDEAKGKPGKKLPTAFSNFFKKSEPETTEAKPAPRRNAGRPRKSLEEKAKKSKKGKASKESSHQEAGEKKKGLHLNSVSLILFDEVDLVFEDDQGFWAAIQTFMATTKRPIILTASDPDFSDRFKGRMEHIPLKPPSKENIATYLQLVCLAENIRTRYHDIQSLVSQNRSSIRNCLLTLQLWVESGCSFTPKTLPIRYAKHSLKEKSEPTTDSPLKALTSAKSRILAISTDSLSADEFDLVVRKPKRKANRLLFDDDSSKDSLCVQSPQKDVKSLGVLSEEISLSGDTDTRNDSEERVELPLTADTPKVHEMVFHSMFGGSKWLPDAGQETCDQAVQVLQGDIDTQNQYGLISHYLDLGLDIFSPNLPHLLPLPKVKATAIRSKCASSDFTKLQLHQTPKKTMSRVLNCSDLYDSEVSNDDYTALSQSSDIEEDLLKPEDQTLVASSPQSKEARNISMKSMDVLAELYNQRCCVDAYFSVPENNVEGPCRRDEYSLNGGKLMPGLDSETRVVDDGLFSSELVNGVSAFVYADTIRRTRGQLKSLCDQVSQLEEGDKSQLEEWMSIPVEDTVAEFRTEVVDDTSQRINQSIHRATSQAAGVLPLSVSGQRVALCMDYLPTIRNMCRVEQFRSATSAKRRFFHYLDPFVQQVKQRTMNQFCTSFQ